MVYLDKSEEKRDAERVILKKFRKEAKLLQQRVADELSISQETFSRYEAKEIPSQYISKLLNLYKKSYEEFEKIRKELVTIIQKSLTGKEKEFLLSFASGNPNWKDFDYSKYPAIKWKQLNINKLKQENPIKFSESVRKLEDLLNRNS